MHAMDTTINPEKRFLGSLLTVSEVFYEVADSITDEDIQAMSIKDKIAALSKLSFILNVAKNYKPNNVFNQVNVFGSSRKELEKAILDYADGNTRISKEL